METRELYMPDDIKKICEIDAQHILDDRGQPPLWPLMVEIGAWYLNKCFLPVLCETIDDLKKIGKSKGEIANLFKAPSRISYPMHQIHYSFGELKGSRGVGILRDLLDFIEFFRREDLFCEKGQNILWSKDDVDKTLKTLDLIYLKNDEKSKEIRKIIGKLNTTLWLYTELITAGHHSICHEFHGPYKLNGNRWLVVREYYDLNLSEIWPFSQKIPANKVITIEVYEDVVIKFDFFNHVESSSDLPSHLVAFLISLENFDTPVKELQNIKTILESVIECISAGNKHTSSFRESDWVTKLVELYFWCLKPHRLLLGDNWQPSSYVYDFIRERNPDQEFNNLMEMVGQIKSGAFRYEKAMSMLVNHYIANIGMWGD